MGVGTLRDMSAAVARPPTYNALENAQVVCALAFLAEVIRTTRALCDAAVAHLLRSGARPSSSTSPACEALLGARYGLIDAISTFSAFAELHNVTHSRTVSEAVTLRLAALHEVILQALATWEERLAAVADLATAASSSGGRVLPSMRVRRRR